MAEPLSITVLVATIIGGVVSLATLGVNLIQSAKIHDINISSCIKTNYKKSSSSSSSSEDDKKRYKKKKRKLKRTKSH